MTYNVFGGTLNLTQSVSLAVAVATQTTLKNQWLTDRWKSPLDSATAHRNNFKIMCYKLRWNKRKNSAKQHELLTVNSKHTHTLIMKHSVFYSNNNDNKHVLKIILYSCGQCRQWVDIKQWIQVQHRLPFTGCNQHCSIRSSNQSMTKIKCLEKDVKS